ncbi:D-aminoacylase [Cellulomonas sp. RIT-PI-Y]|uniref:N-acyl-D-amino-acid deacylase family protein n=1 Tax=Cellulomonas sp. RIT-PI-Y TaxID=3035297 RepID=UPI0021DA2D56|nr:D-aminoacylase [Cellulomonas sp. RIT-PI-Y]
MLLRGGQVVDGTGHEPFTGDVLVEEGRIVAVGGRLDPGRHRVIDADGLVVAPGFIDMHAHSDLAVLTDGAHLAKTLQGVTTEVLGQDGLSYAPTTDASMAVVREQIAGWNGTPDLAFDWRGVAEYLAEIDRRGSATNVAYLLPQGTIRLNVVGTEDRRATPDELAAMAAQVDRGMIEGAFGMSSGLTYVPGMFADTAELAALCAVVARHGGFYAPHQRSYGAGALAAYAEMVEVAHRSSVALHLTHATMNFPENRGRAGELLALVDDALADGVDVTLDSYPYLPGATTLSALLPSWIATGGPAATVQRLRDPSVRSRVLEDVEVRGSDGCHGVPVDWDTIEIAGVRDPALSDRVGRTVAAIARDTATPPGTAFLDLLIADRLGTGILQHVGDEANVRAVTRHPRHTAGSDGILVGAKPHPRGAGTFARYLGRYVREEGVLTLAEAVRHLSGTPAARLGLTDRGRVAAGYVADLVLFDPTTVADRATFAEPRLGPVGIPWVVVGGETVVDDGVRTDRRAGRALRHGSHPGAPHTPGSD